MELKVLGIGDLGDNIFILKKISKHKIHLINFPRKQAELLTYSGEGLEFFDSILISKQVKKIKEIKNQFDLCIVMSWAGARVAYLSGLNFIFYFTGGDIVTPPFIKEPKPEYLKTPVFKFNFIERWFYRRVFNSAAVCVAPFEEYFVPLNKLRNDAIRLDHIVVDTEIFNPNVKPIKIVKNKFTFFSPQKICQEKGFDIIWKALELCKSDFELIQVNWFLERNNEEKEFNKKLLEKIPRQVKLIPLIKRQEIANYFVYADAIFGQMRSGVQGGIERDAAYCKKPVICYTDPNKPIIINGKKKNPPFLPQSNDPRELAHLIDKIVESVEYRNELAEKEFEWIQKLSNPKIVAMKWDEIFENFFVKYKKIDRNYSKINLFILNLLSNILEKIYYKNKMKKKNIKGWGEEVYSELSK